LLKIIFFCREVFWHCKNFQKNKKKCINKKYKFQPQMTNVLHYGRTFSTDTCSRWLAPSVAPTRKFPCAFNINGWTSRTPSPPPPDLNCGRTMWRSRKMRIR
jgi:hypothetical protein